MDDEGRSVFAAPRPDGARDRRGDRSPDAGVRHLLHQHHQREHERQPGERARAELADEVRVDAGGHGDEHHVDDEVRRCETQERRHDRTFEEEASTRGAGLRRGRHRGSAVPRGRTIGSVLRRGGRRVTVLDITGRPSFRCGASAEARPQLERGAVGLPMEWRPAHAGFAPRRRCRRAACRRTSAIRSRMRVSCEERIHPHCSSPSLGRVQFDMLHKVTNVASTSQGCAPLGLGS